MGCVGDGVYRMCGGVSKSMSAASRDGSWSQRDVWSPMLQLYEGSVSKGVVFHKSLRVCHVATTISRSICENLRSWRNKFRIMIKNHTQRISSYREHLTPRCDIGCARDYIHVKSPAHEANFADGIWREVIGLWVGDGM